MHFTTALSAVFAPLLLFPASTSATCSRFTQSGDIWFYDAFSQAQRVSNGTVCNLSNLSANMSTCIYSQTATSNTTGCLVQSSGNINAAGFNNLSLSVADAAPLYPLINSTFNSSEYYNGGVGFNQTSSGCFDNATINSAESHCMPNGTSGYWQLIPWLKCVNGTLDDCDGGPVSNGTAISICGVGLESFQTSNYQKTLGYYPNSYEIWNSTSVEVAESLSPNPSLNGSCFVEQEAAVSGGCRSGSGVGSLSTVLAVAITAGIVMYS